jgi:seryl-tRNA synthetase
LEVTERGGDPEKVRESQRKRNADPGLVDAVIELYEEHRKTQYAANPPLSR